MIKSSQRLKTKVKPKIMMTPNSLEEQVEGLGMQEVKKLSNLMRKVKKKRLLS
jgi:hypothetical protein